MILAAVDDLLFRSKIAAAARQTGADVVFARSGAEALERARESKPALAIFDLDSGRIDPLGTIAAFKADPLLAGVPTLGFVSHVRADLIASARAAGIDEVLARSAFTLRLPDLLAAARRDRPA